MRFFRQLKRRDFIGLLGYSIIMKTTAARAQRAKPTRIGFLRVGPPPPCRGMSAAGGS
jgi:hypothetical protein